MRDPNPLYTYRDEGNETTKFNFKQQLVSAVAVNKHVTKGIMLFLALMKARNNRKYRYGMCVIYIRERMKRERMKRERG